MAEPFHFAHARAFHPDAAEDILRSIPARRGLFALRGERPTDQPYLLRAADLRRRLRRLLLPPETTGADGQPIFSKRLNLHDRVASIQWTETGSDFESTLLLYRATHALFGDAEARKRLRLHCPWFLRVTLGHQHPRVHLSNKMSRRALNESFGPFSSRAAAERVAEAVGELFKLRRCHEDLLVHPEHPGCVYGEMGRCLAPCKAAVTGETYRTEAERAFRYLHTRGESLLTEIALQRNHASDRMDFEAAAGLHRQWEKIRATAQAADPLIRAADQIRALILQPAAPSDSDPASEATPAAAVFLLQHGRLAGPALLSTLGVRAVREQTAVGSSLFAQPLMLQAIPESGSDPAAGNPEARAQSLLQTLQAQIQALPEPSPAERGDAWGLFKRWYYRPEKQRAGEVLLPNPDGSWPIRRLLNAAARVTLGPPAELPTVNRDAAAKVSAQSADKTSEEAPPPPKTRTLHPGREGVERTVPVLPTRRRRGKVALPSQAIL